MNDKFGWCFLGAGSIVKRVMPEMHRTNGGYLASIYSPTYSHAKEIADMYGAVAYASAEAALSDPKVRGVYVATPHTEHESASLMAINAELPVLCEKPFAVNSTQANNMIKAAKEKNIYIMEGMWTRHNPVFRQVLDWIKTGCIGQVRSFTASMTFKSDIDPSLRVFDINRAGGALLDVGIYTIAASQFIFNETVQKISSVGEIAKNGIDRMCAIHLCYPSGIARLFTSSAVAGGNDAMVYGTDGNISIPNFAAPKKASLILFGDRDDEVIYEPEIYNEGFAYEFDAAMDDIRAGKLENEYITHAYTLEAMRIMDKVRKQIGLRYKNE